jgi:hypothetical protein
MNHFWGPDNKYTRTIFWFITKVPLLILLAYGSFKLTNSIFTEIVQILLGPNPLILLSSITAVFITAIVALILLTISKKQSPIKEWTNSSSGQFILTVVAISLTLMVFLTEQATNRLQITRNEFLNTFTTFKSMAAANIVNERIAKQMSSDAQSTSTAHWTDFLVQPYTDSYQFIQGIYTIECLDEYAKAYSYMDAINKMNSKFRNHFLVPPTSEEEINVINKNNDDLKAWLQIVNSSLVNINSVCIPGLPNKGPTWLIKDIVNSN